MILISLKIHFQNQNVKKTELEFNFFENLLIFNQNTLNINEDINKDITDKLYFIGNKRRLEIEDDFNFYFHIFIIILKKLRF